MRPPLIIILKKEDGGVVVAVTKNREYMRVCKSCGRVHRTPFKFAKKCFACYDKKEVGRLLLVAHRRDDALRVRREEGVRRSRSRTE